MEIVRNSKKKNDEYEKWRGKLLLDNGDNTYNRVMMSKMKMPFQKKENDKHKEEDDNVPEKINEVITEDIVNE